jgi:hypothetical protein
MAALTGLSIVASATAAVVATLQSQIFTPTPGKLYIVWAPSTGQTASNAQGTISSSHTGGTWTWNVGTIAAGANSTGAARWWWAIAPAGLSSGAITVTLPTTPAIMDLAVYTTAGDAHATAPIAGITTAQATTATSISATLTAPPVAGDLKVMLVLNRNKTSPPSIVADSGFVSVDQFAKTSPSASYQVAYDLETDTAVLADNVGGTWSAIIGFIIRQEASGGGGPAPFIGFGVPL